MLGNKLLDFAGVLLTPLHRIHHIPRAYPLAEDLLTQSPRKQQATTPSTLSAPQHNQKPQRMHA